MNGNLKCVKVSIKVLKMLENYFYNKKIFITGGTGSLGRSLIAKLKKLNCQIIVYSRDEGKQALYFNDHKNIKKVIGDVRDLEKLKTSMSLYKPEIVIHAAALKRVDDLELYPDECVKTNIVGSENVAIASLLAGVKKCVLISTDKACQPVNVYGSSKFIAERIFTNFDYNSSSTIFASVRYGNVIASRGSFIPLWIETAKEKKIINITSTEMTRFLFTLDDAVDVVLNSLLHATGGEVFIPKIDSFTLPMCVEALSKILKMDIKTNISGIRPGEKLHEDMLSKVEIPFTYEIEGTNLLQVRPQYTNKKYQDFKKYEGLELNSSLWIQNNLEELCLLIKRGLEFSHEII